jgi:uncharacterized membrane protein
LLKSGLRLAVALAMISIGILHFATPAPFVRIVPEVLPAKTLLVYLSGAFEILGGLGLLWSRSRQLASWGLILLYLSVFPANLNMAINEIQLEPGGDISVWALWARLPLQLVFIALVWWLGKPGESPLALDAKKAGTSADLLRKNESV